jgi:hypothetical protein
MSRAKKTTSMITPAYNVVECVRGLLSRIEPLSELEIQSQSESIIAKSQPGSFLSQKTVK